MDEIFKGLVYVKHGRLGSRSEGPDYFLQTVKGDFGLVFHERPLWKPDFELEFYGRRMVEVRGRVEAHDGNKLIHVERLTEIASPFIPRE